MTNFGEGKGVNTGRACGGQFSSRHQEMVLAGWHSPSRLGNAHRPGRGRPGVVENNNQGHRLEKGKSLEKRAPSRGGVKPGAGGISVSAARLLYPGRVPWSVKLDINDQPVGKGMELLVDDSYVLFDCIKYTGKEAYANCVLRSPSSRHSRIQPFFAAIPISLFSSWSLRCILQSLSRSSCRMVSPLELRSAIES